jgi:hypothetical protein
MVFSRLPLVPFSISEYSCLPVMSLIVSRIGIVCGLLRRKKEKHFGKMLKNYKIDMGKNKF